MARENFDSELNRIKDISTRDQVRASKMLDDMGTAFISVEAYGHLDASLTSVRVAKKFLRAKGIKQDVIDDHFLEKSYLSKKRLRLIKDDSIYMNDTPMIKPMVESIPALFTEQTTMDLIIDTLKSKPLLLSALQRGMSSNNLQRDFHVLNPTTIINFYDKYKTLIDN